MADRWLYTHAGAAHGPVDLEKLTQLATQGKLLPTDRVWPVGEDMRRAVEAHTLLNPESFRAAHLKVEETVASPPAPAGRNSDLAHRCGGVQRAGAAQFAGRGSGGRDCGRSRGGSGRGSGGGGARPFGVANRAADQTYRGFGSLPLGLREHGRSPRNGRPHPDPL